MKYLWPFPGNKRITTPWDDPRPVTNPGLHPHGAIDVGSPVGSVIIAPEDGGLFLYFSIRSKEALYWPDDGVNEFPWRNYFYDMFGGVILLKGNSGLSHLFAHSFINQLHNKTRHDWVSMEEKESKRFPLTAMLAGMVRVKAGDHIGETGNAGYSNGPHCHYEIHKGFFWQDWRRRPDPEKLDWRDYDHR